MCTSAHSPTPGRVDVGYWSPDWLCVKKKVERYRKT